MRPILVVMAAGMGSRFGGMKQIAPVGPHGEIILDYACFDAIRAGYEKIVFVIKKENEALFRETAGDRIAKKAEVFYAFQEQTLPRGFEIPEGRVKPWGTGHAALIADYYRCLRTHVPFPIDAFEGGKAVELFLAAYRSAERGGEKVDVE